MKNADETFCTSQFSHFLLIYIFYCKNMQSRINGFLKIALELVKESFPDFMFREL